MGHIRVDTPNTNNKWVGFELANVDTIIIRVWFGLTNVDTIHTLTRYEHDPLTRIAAPVYCTVTRLVEHLMLLIYNAYVFQKSKIRLDRFSFKKSLGWNVVRRVRIELKG